MTDNQNNMEDETDESSILPSKLVLLGESAVGKSSLVLRFVRGFFSENHESTIGAAFLTQIVPLDNGLKVKLEIWDTAGQERFRSLTPMYYRGAKAAIVVYDVTKYDTFTKAQGWVKELQKTDSKIIIFLAGNKTDLEKQRKVDYGEANNWALEMGVKLREVSAKTDTKVSDLFIEIANILPKENPDEEVEEKQEDVVGLKDLAKVKKKKGCKCG